MAYRAAYLDKNNIVVNIIEIKEDTQIVADSFLESQKVFGAIKAILDSSTKTGTGVGWKYLGKGVCQPPQPYPSWIWVDVENTIPHWSSPKPMPEDGQIYIWVEEEVDWIEQSIVFNRNAS